MKKTFIILLSISLWACGKKEEAPRAPKDVLVRLEQKATEHFASNKTAIENWVNLQEQSYLAINSIVPEIPLEVFSEIRKSSEEKFDLNFVDQLKHINSQMQAYTAIDNYKFVYEKDVCEKTNVIIAKFFEKDYILREKMFAPWANFLKQINIQIAALNNPALFEKLDAFISESEGNPDNAKVAMTTLLDYKSRVERMNAPFNELVSQFAEVKKEAADLYPEDYAKQYSYLEQKSRELSANYYAQRAQASSERRDSNRERAANKDGDMFIVTKEHEEMIKNIFNKSVFTTRGYLETVNVAILVNINDKKVILCSPQFLTNKLPITFGNSSATITCSSAMMSSDYPLIMLIPDSIPESCEALEIITADDVAKILDKNMFMIAPSQSSLRLATVSIFSEDTKYLNMSYGALPRFSRVTTLKPLNRSGTSLLITTTTSSPEVSQAIIIDPDSGKLVSMAVDRYNPGVITSGGTTGSIVGHEVSAMPDYNTLVRQFDGALKTTKPFGTIDFIRMTNLTSWTKFSIDELNKQKTTLRKYTDLNNDFLMFFKNNSYDTTLRSRTLGSIAEKHRQELLYQRMSRVSYERTYKAYMLEVLYALKRETISPLELTKYYAAYRDALEFQINLRNAMHDYLAEAIKDGNVINILHNDLRSRYEDTGPKVKTTPIGGGIGGGH